MDDEGATATRSRGAVSSKTVRTVVYVAIAVIVLIDAFDALRSLRRRLSRTVAAWWSDVEREERRHRHHLEVNDLAQVLGRTHAHESGSSTTGSPPGP